MTTLSLMTAFLGFLTASVALWAWRLTRPTALSR